MPLLVFDLRSVQVDSCLPDIEFGLLPESCNPERWQSGLMHQP